MGLSLAAIISIVIGFILLSTTIGPAIIHITSTAPIQDPNTNALFLFLVPAMFGMLIVTAFMYATNRKPSGLWGE